MTPNLNKWAAKILIDEVENFTDCKINNPMDFCERFNVDGSVSYNREEARQWIIANWYEIGDVFDDMNGSIDSTFNIFYDCEKLEVLVLLWIANDILCGFFQPYEGKTLTDSDIKAIQNHLEGYLQ